MKKILLLTERGQEFVRPDPSLCDSWHVTRDIPRWLRLFIKAFEILGLPVSSLRYGGWKHKIHEYDVIVVFHCAVNNKASFPAMQLVHRKKSGKVVVWYSGKISDKGGAKNVDKFRELSDEIWTYSENDSLEYGIRFANVFYCDYHLPERDIQYDACFIGYAKKRYTQIFELEDTLRAQGFNTNFYVVALKSQNIEPRYACRCVDEAISYDQILDMVAKSKAIVEISNYSPYEITLRAMESIYLKKKLISNAPEIKEHDFYTPENVFIIGEDDPSGLESFLNSPYVELDASIYQKYRFQTWLETITS